MSTHRWDYDNERRLAGQDQPDGNARNIRSCLKCGMIMATIIPPHGYPWHEYTLSTGSIIRSEKRPPCTAETRMAAK